MSERTPAMALEEAREMGRHGRYMAASAVLEQALTRLAEASELDEELLARALDRVEKGIATRYPGATYPSRHKAARLIVEYARLRAER